MIGTKDPTVNRHYLNTDLTILNSQQAPLLNLVFIDKEIEDRRRRRTQGEQGKAILSAEAYKNHQVTQELIPANSEGGVYHRVFLDEYLHAGTGFSTRKNVQETGQLARGDLCGLSPHVPCFEWRACSRAIDYCRKIVNVPQGPSHYRDDVDAGEFNPQRSLLSVLCQTCFLSNSEYKNNPPRQPT